MAPIGNFAARPGRALPMDSGPDTPRDAVGTPTCVISGCVLDC